jgi:hypothetical protein
VVGEVLGAAADSTGEPEAFTTSIHIPSEISTSLEGQSRTPRQLIGDLIRRKQATGSRELIPANDPIAQQILQEALRATVSKDIPA